MSGDEGLEERISEVRKALEGVRALIRVRDEELRDKEVTKLLHVATRKISLLNPGARRMQITFATLAGATLELECRIHRRGMFYLRTRERRLVEELVSLEARLLPQG